MSGLARIMQSRGSTVTGSDRTESNITRELCRDGIAVAIGHDLLAVARAELVVYTAAIPDDDAELIEARRCGIPTVTRAELLGALMGEYTHAVGIAGTHGKTTTTGLLSCIFLAAGLDPTLHIGGNVAAVGGSVRVGGHDYFISEACEYAESFLSMEITSAILLNIDNDHLDYYKDMAHVCRAFENYVKRLPKDGVLVANADDELTVGLCEQLRDNTRIISFGIECPEAHYRAQNIRKEKDGRLTFDVMEKGELLGTLTPALVGKHNVYNVLSCVAMARHYGIGFKAIREAVAAYTGADRRFTRVGKLNGAQVIHDYAHHPTEIRATLEAAAFVCEKELYCVFQPHTYSRTKNLFDDMACALSKADHIIVTDIYAAREKNIYGIHAKDLVRALCQKGVDAVYIPEFERIAEYLQHKVTYGDVVINMGAGSIEKLNGLLCPETEEE